jgi:carbamate kinase
VDLDISVFALGGNALLAKGEEPTFGNMLRNIKRTVRQFKSVFESEMNVVMTHGNGPQVGEELLRSEYSERKVPALPFYVSNAETQAEIGTALEIEIRNMLYRISSTRDVVNVVTHVLVENGKEDLRPVKPVGPYYTRTQLRNELRKGRFAYIKEKGAFRKIVPSPRPRSILESGIIDRLARSGTIVIACGGGGAPVIRRNGAYNWIDGVIDKDLSTQVLASSMRAKHMTILTDADYLYMNYPKEPARRITARELRMRLPSFEDGTIKPKVLACINFVKKGGKEARIGNLFQLDKIMEGRAGTKIVR